MKRNQSAVLLVCCVCLLVALYHCHTSHKPIMVTPTFQDDTQSSVAIQSSKAHTTKSDVIKNIMGLAATKPPPKTTVKAKTNSNKYITEQRKLVSRNKILTLHEQERLRHRQTNKTKHSLVPKYSPLRGTNHCLQLAPKKYIQNEARTFTTDELNALQNSTNDPLIPKIIHQTWDTYTIPKPAEQYVRSVIERHAGWEYWFWTEADIRCYMQTKHPEYMSLYDSYPATIFRTDVMRYFILYDYGGFYMDLDVECLKPLDAWTKVASSILSHETYEHTFFAHMRRQPNVMTTVLATKPRHPYYKLLQENLQRYHNACPKDVLYSTGPFYIDNIYQLYVQNATSSREDNITIIHPRYWLPTYALSTEARVRSQCKTAPVRPHAPLLTKEQIPLCALARQRNFQNKPYLDSYLNHHWANSNVKGSKFLTTDTVSMFKILPNLLKVSDRVGLSCK